MEESDAILRLHRGEIAALDVLVRRYQLRAVRAAYLVTRDRALAEDVVQATFLRVYERIGQFDDRRPFAPWFLRSVVHAAVKASMRQDRSRSLDRDADDTHPDNGCTVPDPAPTVETMWEQVETRQEMWEALGRLAPIHRAAIVQRYYLGLSETEMADGLDCPVGTVKSRLHTARQRLRLLLQPMTNQ